jgi:hypothetical protein
MHEDFGRAHAVRAGSDRAFGLVFAAFFLILALAPLARGNPPHLWLVVPAAAAALVALLRPRVLAPLNRVWTRIGLLLGRVLNPIVLGVMFFGFVTPLGVLMRLTGKDLLRLRRDPNARSYWIPRTPAGPSPESLTRQF